MITAEIVNINKPSAIMEGTTVQISGSLKNISLTSEKLRFQINYYDKNWQMLVATSGAQTLAPGGTMTFTVSPQIPIGGQTKFQARIVDFNGVVTYARDDFTIVVNKIAPAPTPVAPTPAPTPVAPTPVAPTPVVLDTMPKFSIGDIIYNSAEDYPRTGKVKYVLGTSVQPSYMIMIVPDGIRTLEYGTYDMWRLSSHNREDPVPPYEFGVPPNVVPPSEPTITYTDQCVGDDLYRNKYVGNDWINRILVERNSTQCGYVAPTPDPEIPILPPVAPTPVAPTPVAPTPVAPTPVAPTPVAPTPVAPTPVAPTPVAPTPAPTPDQGIPILPPVDTPIPEIIAQAEEIVKSLNDDTLVAVAILGIVSLLAVMK